MLKPFDARVIVKKPERQEQTASGIILPDTAAEQGQTAEGIVISVGRGSRNMTTGEWMPIPLKEGDRIIYSKFSAQEVQFEEEEYFIVAERDIVAVVMK
jgi:chaperonin GroES|tara:strand:+ start:331 stop:627 length:297 start_codon:yes stop_codon:yes gene_type:complete